MKEEKYIFPFEKSDVWNMAVDLAEKVLDNLEVIPSRTKLQ